MEIEWGKNQSSDNYNLKDKCVCDHVNAIPS